MEGPLDPHSPDTGATEPVAQDGDLHALLERLLGQGDVRPAAPGSGDDLWPDLFPVATATPDDASTIVPAPDALVAEIETAAAIHADLAPARAWEPVVIDSPAESTNVDDIHAAILASISVDLEPIVPVARLEVGRFAELPTKLADDRATDVLIDVATEALPAEPEPVDFALTEPPALALVADVEPAPADPAPLATDFVDSLFATEAIEHRATARIEAASPRDSFELAPFEAPPYDTFVDMGLDADALWAAALPELGLDIAPQLDLDADEEPVGATAVVLPWPSHEPKAEAPAAAPAPQDLIEAALSGVHADLTSEPVEPLRTPDVAAATAHVVFRLGGRIMAVPLAAVSEIARPPRTTRLPHVPAWVLGIANLRGDIVSMLDLEGFFTGKAGKGSHEQRMLALKPSGDEVRTAVLVDSVDGIQAFEDARVVRVTRGFDAEVAPYARGLYQMEDELVVVLDADRLLQSKPMRQFEDGAGAR